MLPTPGAGEILLILLLVFIVFFGEKVGALGDAIGKARDEFRRGKTDDDRIAVKRVEPATVTRVDSAAHVEQTAPHDGDASVASANPPSEERASDTATAPSAERDEKSGA